MAPPNDYEKRRLENIARNQALINELGLVQKTNNLTSESTNSIPRRPGRPRKTSPDEAKRTTTPSGNLRKRKRTDDDLDSATVASATRRSSARLAVSDRPDYSRRARLIIAGDGVRRLRDSESVSGNGSRTVSPAIGNTRDDNASPSRPAVRADAEALRAGWAAWTPVATPPTKRDSLTGEFHFEDRPDFTPNKSPEEILREGAFGGTYYRPLRSTTLGIIIADDWRELPEEWFTGLDVERFATSGVYDADVNKFKVACGQSIEEWERSGWINHEFDVRGWFQWYCRFWMGRRCEDDDRQVSRWRKCVGPTGRWKRTLLKRYKERGVREVFDDGEEEGKEVSPVVHQTCHHWAFEVRQTILDEYWRTG